MSSPTKILQVCLGAALVLTLVVWLSDGPGRVAPAGGGPGAESAQDLPRSEGQSPSLAQLRPPSFIADTVTNREKRERLQEFLQDSSRADSSPGVSLESELSLPALEGELPSESLPRSVFDLGGASSVTRLDRLQGGALSLPSRAGRRSSFLPLSANAGGDLGELQRGYQAAMSHLFGVGGVPGAAPEDGPVSENPFEEALDDTPSDSPPDETVEPPPAQDEPPQEEVEPPAQDDPPDNQETPEDPPVEDEIPPGSGADYYDFLATGLFPEPGSDPITRAWRSDTNVFQLEDSTEVSFVPGFVRFELFDGNTRVHIGDVDGNGFADATLVYVFSPIGTYVETYLQDREGFELYASTLTYLQGVRCVEYFDFDQDGLAELAAVLEGSPNLHVYRKDGSEWRHWQEIELPLHAGILFRTQEGSGSSDSVLYIGDEEFRRVVNILSRRPEVVRGRPSLPLDRTGLLSVQWTEADQRDPRENVLFIQMADTLVVADRRGETVRWLATLQGSETPRTIIGAYNDGERRQIIWFP